MYANGSVEHFTCKLVEFQVNFNSHSTVELQLSFIHVCKLSSWKFHMQMSCVSPGVESQLNLNSRSTSFPIVRCMNTTITNSAQH